MKHPEAKTAIVEQEKHEQREESESPFVTIFREALPNYVVENEAALMEYLQHKKLEWSLREVYIFHQLVVMWVNDIHKRTRKEEFDSVILPLMKTLIGDREAAIAALKEEFSRLWHEKHDELPDPKPDEIQLEKERLQKALIVNRFKSNLNKPNIKKAAESLGMDDSTFRRKCIELKLLKK